MDRAVLEESGIDYAAGVRRFMGDSELYERLLAAFLSDDSLLKAAEAFRRRDYRELFAQAHALKGASGNLDMARLYRASGELAEYLRREKEPERSAVAALFDKMLSSYRQVIGGIRAAAK